MFLAVFIGLLIDLSCWMLLDRAVLRLGLLMLIRSRADLSHDSYQSIAATMLLFCFYFLLYGNPFWVFCFLALILWSLFLIAHLFHQHYYVIEVGLGFFYLLAELVWWHHFFSKVGEINEFTFIFISVNLILLCGIVGRQGNRSAKFVERKVRTPNRIDSL